MVDISLRRHIERRTDFNVFEKIRINCRKTKINYFRHAFFNHDIWKLDISVNDVSVIQVEKSLKYLIDNDFILYLVIKCRFSEFSS